MYMQLDDVKIMSVFIILAASVAAVRSAANESKITPLEGIREPPIMNAPAVWLNER